MTALNITQLDSTKPEFNKQLKDLLAWDETDDLEIHQRVLDIIANVRKNGDKAVLEYSNQFDQTQFKKATDFELSQTDLKQAPIIAG